MNNLVFANVEQIDFKSTFNLFLDENDVPNDFNARPQENFPID
jgi:hypothetical protein